MQTKDYFKRFEKKRIYADIFIEDVLSFYQEKESFSVSIRFFTGE